MPSTPQRNQGTLATIGKASIIGLHMVSGVLVGGFLGWWLDDWLGTSPWFVCIFFVIGVAAGFLNVWRDVHSILREQNREPARKQDDAR